MAEQPLMATPLPVRPEPVEGRHFTVTDHQVEIGAKQMRTVLDDPDWDDETALLSALEAMGIRAVSSGRGAA